MRKSVMQLITSFLLGFVITILSPLLPLKGIEFMLATYCGEPKGLPLAFTTEILPGQTTCLAMISDSMKFFIIFLDSLLWGIILYLLIKIIQKINRK